MTAPRPPLPPDEPDQPDDPGEVGDRPWRLAPGLRVVRRGRDRLQVGLHPGRRAVLPRSPEVERVLAGLLAPPGRADQGPDDDPAVTAVLEALLAAGCLVPERGAARPRVRLVTAPGSQAGTDLATLVREQGGRVVDADPVDAVLLGAVGEPLRERLDPLVRAGTPHQLLRLVDGGALVGPLVVPGRTACLRCVEAADADHDPDVVAVTHRYARATARPRSDGVADVADPALAALAAAWAVGDLLAALAGGRPASWSATVHLAPDRAAPVVRHHRRHPRCGCSWGLDSWSSGTMGA